MQITRGRLPKAIKTLVYGTEGIGKSTFASQFPGAVFIDTEGSTTRLDVARTPSPKSFSEILEQVRYFINHPSEAGTVIIDTADWAEKLAIKSLCDKKHIDGLEELGYGKGYVYVYEDMGRLLNALDELIDKGVNVTVTAHAALRKFEQPDELTGYDRWELKCINAPKANVCAMLKEWADMVLFVNWKTVVLKAKKDDKKAKATGGEERVMYTQHRACWDAKNRFDLPEELPFSFSAIAHLFEKDARSQIPRENPPTRPYEAPEIKVDNVPPEAREPEKPAATPQAEPKTEPSAEGRQFEAFEDEAKLPSELVSLLKVSEIHAHELRFVVTERGYFPNDMMASDYPLEFIDEWVIPCWKHIRDRVNVVRQENPFLNSDVQIPF